MNALYILESRSNFSHENLLKNYGTLICIFYRLVEENFKNTLVNIKKSYSRQSADSNPSLLKTMYLIPNDLSLTYKYNECTWKKSLIIVKLCSFHNASIGIKQISYAYQQNRFTVKKLICKMQNENSISN